MTKDNLLKLSKNGHTDTSIFQESRYSYRIILFIKVKICLHGIYIMFTVQVINHIPFIFTDVWFDNIWISILIKFFSNLGYLIFLKAIDAWKKF